MVKMMDVHNVLYAYSILGSKIAEEWCENDIMIKNIAISYEEICKDTGEQLALSDVVAVLIDTEDHMRKAS